MKNNINQAIEKTKEIYLGAKVACNPVVKMLKKQASDRHRSEPGTHLDVHLDSVAKNHGFEDWSHLMGWLKKEEKNPSEIPFIVSQAPVISTKEITELSKRKPGTMPSNKNYQANDNLLCLGYDTYHDNYKWQSKSNQTTHHFVVGEGVYRNYDTYLASQVIKQNQKVIFLNCDSDINTLECLVGSAKHRLQDVKILNLTGDDNHVPEPYKIYEHRFNDSFMLSGSNHDDKEISSEQNTRSFLTQMLETNGNVQSVEDPYIEALLLCAIPVIFEYHDLKSGLTLLNLETIKSGLSFRFLENAKNNDDKTLSPDHAQRVESYFNLLDQNWLKKDHQKQTSLQFETLEKAHEFLANTVNVLIDALLQSGAFKSSESHRVMSLTETFGIHNNHVVIIQMKKNDLFMTKLMMKNFYRAFAFEFGAQNDALVSDTNPRKRLAVRYLFLRNFLINPPWYNFAAQARARGVSITWSYPNLASLNEELKESVIANANTKIAGFCDEATLLELCRNDKPVDLNLIKIKTSSEVLVIKKGFQYPLQF